MNTRFLVRAPNPDVPERHEIEARVPIRTTKALRILLVEDHGETQRALSRLLSYFGHEISVADSTRSALEFVDAKKFDLVLSNIALPDGTGYDVISNAKQKQQVKGVVLAAFGRDEDIRRSKEVGFDFPSDKAGWLLRTAQRSKPGRSVIS